MKELLLLTKIVAEFKYFPKEGSLFSKLNVSVSVLLLMVKTKYLCHIIPIVPLRYFPKLVNSFLNLEVKEVVMDNSWVQLILLLTIMEGSLLVIAITKEFKFSHRG